MSSNTCNGDQSWVRNGSRPKPPRWYRERLAELNQLSLELSGLLERLELRLESAACEGDSWSEASLQEEIEGLRCALYDVGEEMATLREGWQTIAARARRLHH